MGGNSNAFHKVRTKLRSTINFKSLQTQLSQVLTGKKAGGSRSWYTLNDDEDMLSMVGIELRTSMGLLGPA